MQKQKSFFLSHRQIFLNGGPSEDQTTEKPTVESPKSPERDKDLESLDPIAIGAKGKDRAQELVSGKQKDLDDFQKLQEGGFSNEYKPEPFTAEWLAEKTKGYKEIKPFKTPIDIVSIGLQNAGGQMEHGGVTSLFIDLEDGKGEKEYIILCDESKGKKYRVFKQP